MNSIVSRANVFIFAFLMALFITQFISLPSAAADEATDPIDTNQWYRLTNMFLGTGFALETYSGATNDLFMGDSGNYSGQYWKFTPAGDGYYFLTSMAYGDGRFLDTYGDTHEPFMAYDGGYSGQYWQLIPAGDGYFRLSNMFLGNGRSLDTYSDTYDPFMGNTGNYSGQFWQLTPLGHIEDEAAITPTQNDIILTEPPVQPDEEVFPTPLTDVDNAPETEEIIPEVDFLSDTNHSNCIDMSLLAGELDFNGSIQEVCLPEDPTVVFEQLKTLDYDVCAAMVGGPNVGKVAAFSDMAEDLNMTVTVGVGYGGGVGISGTSEAGVMIGPDGQAGCYIAQCFGAEIDIQGSVYENLGLYTGWDKVPGRSVVISEGASIPFIEAGYSTSQVLVSDKLEGVNYTFSAGLGLLPVDLSGMYCGTSTVQVRPFYEVNSSFRTRAEVLAEIERVNAEIEKMHATIQAERDNNSQGIVAAQTAVQTEQNKLDQIDHDITQMRNTIQAERDQDFANLQAARDDVNAAQSDVNSLRTNINSTQQQIDQINKDIAAKKRWLDDKAWYDKVWAGPEYLAYESAKRVTQGALYTKIASLEVALQTAAGGLEVAKGSLLIAQESVTTLPMEADPRLASLYTARETANTALEAAIFTLGGTNDLLTFPPIESDPRMIDLYAELGVAQAELDLFY
ncbi:MAG: hypothetical protein KDE48_15200 [Anaerolineales bacterium]|nr:hypothetical protein [Anaerolineales bacterium]